MATIKLTRVKCKNLTTKEDMWRLGVKSIGNVSSEDFVKHAAEHCDVKAVLTPEACTQETLKGTGVV